MIKKGLLTMLLTALLCTMCACGLLAFDAATYLQGGLDALYLNEISHAYLRIVEDDREELEETHRAGLEQEVKYFMQYADINGVSKETEQRILAMYEKIYPYSKYKVGESTKDGKDYFVSLTVYPIDVMKKAFAEDGPVYAFLESYNARKSAGAFDGLSEEEENEVWADGVLTAVESELDNIGYLDPVNLSIPIIDGGSYYAIDDGGMLEIDELIIAY